MVKIVRYSAGIDDTANEQMEMLVRQIMQCQGITEDMKSEDWIGWLGVVNNIHSIVHQKK